MADATHRPVTRQPPLDKGYFSIGAYGGAAYGWNHRAVVEYMSRHYGEQLVRGNPEHDSIERTMATLYIDSANPILRREATKAFVALVRSFGLRLARTTNNLSPGQNGYLYRIICHYLVQGLRADEIAIVTFNQDIQVEKALWSLCTARKWRSKQLFRFPGCYCLGLDEYGITTPNDVDGLLFPVDLTDGGVRVLKLHGSFNWFGEFDVRTAAKIRMQDFTATDLFQRDSPIKVSRLTTLLDRVDFIMTAPVIVPPVSTKSAIMHERVSACWIRAEQELLDASEILVFGYSCPTTDYESTNLIRRVMGKGRCGNLVIIDPSPATLSRYVQLTDSARISYYRSAEHFLGQLPGRRQLRLKGKASGKRAVRGRAAKIPVRKVPAQSPFWKR
jgi:hypothetical protein